MHEYLDNLSKIKVLRRPKWGKVCKMRRMGTHEYLRFFTRTMLQIIANNRFISWFFGLAEFAHLEYLAYLGPSNPAFGAFHPVNVYHLVHSLLLARFIIPTRRLHGSLHNIYSRPSVLHVIEFQWLRICRVVLEALGDRLRASTFEMAERGPGIVTAALAPWLLPPSHTPFLGLRRV